MAEITFMIPDKIYYKVRVYRLYFHTPLGEWGFTFIPELPYAYRVCTTFFVRLLGIDE